MENCSLPLRDPPMVSQFLPGGEKHFPDMHATASSRKPESSLEELHQQQSYLKN